MDADATILVLNCGSSSVKAAWFRAGSSLTQLGSSAAENVGSDKGRFWVKRSDGELVRDEPLDVGDHDGAIDLVLTHLETWESTERVVAVGHRVVHGGADLEQPCIVNGRVLHRLERLTPLAPLHMPANLAGIAEAGIRWPAVPQIACFDTGFHRTLPPVAKMLGLPHELHRQGVRRYGFHGLSYESIVENLAQQEGESVLAGRIIVAHLGSGASMAALRNGESIDTTMGFSTLGGLLMGTRCGDMDPGVLLYLLNEGMVDIPGAQALLYHKCGLLGVSGVSSEMRELLEQESLTTVRAAIDLFCYSARKHLAALTTALGGLDRLVFTGGIGEYAYPIRQRICANLDYLGILLDRDRNQCHARTISAPESPVVVNVIPTNEELVIARHTYRLAVAAHSRTSAALTSGRTAS